MEAPPVVVVVIVLEASERVAVFAVLVRAQFSPSHAAILGAQF
jgi:hypothetical protein